MMPEKAVVKIQCQLLLDIQGADLKGFEGNVQCMPAASLAVHTVPDDILLFVFAVCVESLWTHCGAAR